MTISLASYRQPARPSGGKPGEDVAPPVPAAPLRLVPQPEGLLQVHTAPFRGSVASVFSQAIRSAGLGSRVLVSQFLRGGVDQGVQGSLELCGRLQWLRPATLLCIEQPLTSLDPAEAEQLRLCVADVWDYSRDRLLAGKVDLLVLDELGLALEWGYLEPEEVRATLERRPAHLDVILTGPAMPPVLLAMADQVTQLRRCA